TVGIWNRKYLRFGEGGGIVPHHWYKWKDQCPIIGISGRNSVPSLVSVGRNSAPSLVSVEGIVSHHWYWRVE
ncbi:unnamed protein product, partial [Staurois parvus]